MPLPYFSSAIIAAVVSSYFSGPTPSGSSAVNTSPHRLQRSRSSSYTVAANGACPTILTSVRGSFCGYTLPFSQPGQASPVCSVECGTATFRAPVYAVAPLRPWPGGGSVPCADGAADCSSTALVFSVLRGFASIPTSACSAPLSLSPSDSLNGACVPRSMIWSSSSRFTSIRGRFMRRVTPGTCDAVASPASVLLAVSVPTWGRDVRGPPSCRSPSSWPRDNTSRENARCPRMFPTNKSDARTATSSLAEQALPCAPECATPDVPREPTAESESACCRPTSARCARALHRSIRYTGRAPSGGAERFARLGMRSPARRLSLDTSSAHPPAVHSGDSDTAPSGC